MSTRSIIGIAHDGGFTGRYAHWDGYPTCRGAQLQRTYAELGSAQAVIDWAVREGQTGYWSSYGTPADLVAEVDKPDEVPCTLCGATGNRTDIKLHKPNWCNGCNGTGQARNYDKREHWSATDDDVLVASTDDVGAEWAYLLDDKGITVLSFDRADGTKAIGMFGSIGDGYWNLARTVGWDEQVDWQLVECGDRFERCSHYAWVHFPEAEGTNTGIHEWLAEHPLPSADDDEKVPF